MKSMRYFLSFVLCVVIAAPTYAQSGRDEAIDAQVFALVVDSSTSDGKAAVYQLDGKAMITPQGSPEERDLKVGDEIGIGDAIYTEKGASISISFDNRKQNAVRIPAETKATFTSIEPTDIKLDDGTIFSVVNGLAKGSTWKITTPSAVAAVRGTVFETTYHADTKEFFAATLEVADDGKTSAIEVESLMGGGVAEIAEGQQMLVGEGESPNQEKVEVLSADKAADIQQFNQEVAAESKKADENANNNGGGNGPGGNSGTTGGGPGSGPGTNGNSPVSPFDVTPNKPMPDRGEFFKPIGPEGSKDPDFTNPDREPPKPTPIDREHFPNALGGHGPDKVCDPPGCYHKPCTNCSPGGGGN